MLETCKPIKGAIKQGDCQQLMTIIIIHIHKTNIFEYTIDIMTFYMKIMRVVLEKQ